MQMDTRFYHTDEETQSSGLRIQAQVNVALKVPALHILEPVCITECF